MRILDRYIVREVLRHALLGLIIFTFVLFVPKLVRLMELFVRHSGSGSQIAVLSFALFPASWSLPFPCPFWSACCWGSAACPWTAKSLL